MRFAKAPKQQMSNTSSERKVFKTKDNEKKCQQRPQFSTLTVDKVTTSKESVSEIHDTLK